MNVVEFLSQLNGETEILLSLSIILFSGFILTRMTNTLNMPKVSGYILAGILIGPCCFNFIPAPVIDGMSFVSDLALSFIAFGVGKFFKKEVLMRTGRRIIIITISEALAAGVLVTFCLKFIFNLNWEFALILGAIATATAPASTMMTINQYKAKGEFVDTLLQIVALDDVVCLLAFSIVTAIINGNAAGGFSAHDLLIPVAYNLLVIVLGIFCGYFLSRLLIPARSKDNRLILAIAMLLGLSGICAAIDISPLLSCMVFGAVYINLTRDKKLFRQINSFTPPVMSVFFIVSGMNLDLNALKTVGAIGVSYFVIRIVGKYMGTYLSCLFTKTSRQIRNYMGFALIPQAGVAIGLAFLGQRMLPPETGNMMLTIILSSSVLYEMVGPVSAKAALVLSGSIPFGKRPEEMTEAAEGVLESENGENEEEASAEEAEKASGFAELGNGKNTADLICEKKEYPAYSEKKEKPEEKKNPEVRKLLEDKEDLTEKRTLTGKRGAEAREDEDAQWRIAAQKEMGAAAKAEIVQKGEAKPEAGTGQEATVESGEETEQKGEAKPEVGTGQEGAVKSGEETEQKGEAKPEAGTGQEATVESGAETGKEATWEAEHAAEASVAEVPAEAGRETAEVSAEGEAATAAKASTVTDVPTVAAVSVVTDAEETLSSEARENAALKGKKEASDTWIGEETETGEKEAKKPEEDKNKEKLEESSVSEKSKGRRKKKSGKTGGKEDKADRKEKSAGKKRGEEEPEKENSEVQQEKESQKKEGPESGKEIEVQETQKVQEESEEQEIFRQFMDPELMEENDPEEEEDHAVLPELREYSRGVEERDVYDIEREVKPQKNKKKKKGKKADGKVRKE